MNILKVKRKITISRKKVRRHGRCNGLEKSIRSSFLSATWHPYCHLSVTVEEAASLIYYTLLFSLQVPLEDHQAHCSQVGPLSSDKHEVEGLNWQLTPDVMPWL